MAHPSQINLIWDYFSKDVQKNKTAICNQCSKSLSYRTSITNLKTHLKAKHIGHYNVFIAEKESIIRSLQVSNADADPLLTPMVVKPESSPSTSEDQQEQVQVEETWQHAQTQQNIFDYTRIKSLLRTEEKKHIDAMLLKLFARTYQPFSIVEEADFIEFVEALNPNYVLPERKEISQILIPFLYNKCLEQQKKMLHQEAATVCLTTDCWTSIKMDAFISVTAHFINNDYEFKSVVLKCSEITGAHTSENLASILRNICVEWDIFDKINVCVTDNAAHIVGAIHILGWKHYECTVHKLNLTLEHPLQLFDDTLKKVKKIVTYYRSTYKAEETLMEYQAKVQGISQPLVGPIRINSVPTIWNSTYFMIERFVHLQDTLTAMQSNLNVDLPIITGEEWIALRQLCKVLKPFSEAAKELSAEKYVCASKVIAIISGLKDVMQEVQRKPSYFDAMENIITDIDTQLNSRFHDLEYEENLALCTILDPRYKISMFIDDAAAEHAKNTLVEKVMNLMKTQVTGLVPLTVTPATTEPQTSSTQEDDVDDICLWRKRNLIIENRKYNPQHNLSKLAQQEVETYLQDDYTKNNCNPCDWWRSSGQYKYPHLGELFKTFCNIVATSVPSEILFSKAGYTLSERRSRLSVKKTEELVFLNSNLNNCDFLELMS